MKRPVLFCLSDLVFGLFAVGSNVEAAPCGGSDVETAAGGKRKAHASLPAPRPGKTLNTGAGRYSWRASTPVDVDLVGLAARRYAEEESVSEIEATLIAAVKDALAQSVGWTLRLEQDNPISRLSSVMLELFHRVRAGTKTLQTLHCCLER